jgi:hypothetical protein
MFSSFPDVLLLDNCIALLVRFVCLSPFPEFFFPCISISIVLFVEISRQFLYNILVSLLFSRLYLRLVLFFLVGV